MKHLYKHTVLLIVLCCSVFAQNTNAQGWVWAKSVYSPSGGVDGWITTTDIHYNAYEVGMFQGDSITFGTSTFHNNAPNYQTTIAKYDSSGNLRWGLASTHGQSMPLSFTTDNKGNAYLYGLFFTDSIRFGSLLLINNHIDSALYSLTPGYGCYFILKFDTSGNIVWSKTGDNIAAGWGSGGGIATDASSNVYIIGTYLNSTIQIGPYLLINASVDTEQIFIAKYDSSGNVIWAESFGGRVREFGVGMTISPNYKLFITGLFSSDTLSFGSTYVIHSGSFGSLYYAYSTFIAQMDTSGNVVWANSPVGCATVQNIAIDSANNIVIGGFIGDTSYMAFGSDTLRDANLSTGAFFAKFDSVGNPLWAKGIYPMSSAYMGYSGYTNNKVYGLTTDPCSNIWISCGLNNEDTAAGIRIDSTTIIHVPFDSEDPMLFAEYSPNGSLLQYFTFLSGGDDYSSLAADRAGNIFLCDDTWANLVFGSDTVKPIGGETMYLAKYNPNHDCSINLPVTPITGDTILCKGDTTTLTDTTAGGTWSSSNPSIATVGSATGLVTAVAIGTTTITYSVGTGYVTKTISVDPPPSAIMGVQWVCVDTTTSLSDSTVGGVWSSSNTAVATVGSTSGIVTGVSGFSATITYSISAGCYVTIPVYVSSLCNDAVPSIAGKTSQVSIFPNPATTNLTILSSGSPIIQVTITNLLSQTVYFLPSAPANCKLQTVNCAAFPPGIYFVKVNGTEVRKFVKE